ncbi:MAG TPA: ABC transporter ATP-binding protein [Patescibacteria group bacterium]|nr:ABC transporter ATP-binding protein [Patescibacteria group bacterium]
MNDTSLRALRIYLTYWRMHPWLVAGAALMGPAYVLQGILCPLFIAKALGQLASHTPVSTAYLWLAGGSLISGALLRYASDRYCIMQLCAKTTRDIYNANLKHLLKQEYGFFANSFGGSLVAQANRFAKGYEVLNTVFFLDAFGLLCGVLVAIGIMMHYNFAIGLAVAGLWVASVSIVIYLAIRRMAVRRAAVAKESEQTGELADIITNAVTVKTFAQESNEQRRYGATNQERSNRYYRSWEMAVRNTLAINLLCGTLQLTVFIGGIIAVQHHALTIAAFLLFQLYILRIIDSIGVATSVVRQFEGILGDAHEMTELLGRTPVIKDPEHPEPSRINQGDIELRNVVFSYHEQADNAQALLNGFNLQIKPGEKVGLVGPSGGGKSTLTKLLLRFVDIQSGTIAIDGQDIRTILQDDLHQAISYVPQEPLLFHRSIKENIRYGNPDADEQDIIRVAKQAHAHEFIKDLPHGYDTMVGERGVKLSGGQRQRIAIARAMVKKAPILVLDEATSALDSESEAYIQDGLWKLMQGKTTIVIAHRLSTIQRMDRIVVLDKGTIVEEGTHSELVKRKGLYGKLWAHQSGGFIEEA